MTVPSFCAKVSHETNSRMGENPEISTFRVGLLARLSSLVGRNNPLASRDSRKLCLFCAPRPYKSEMSVQRLKTPEPGGFIDVIEGNINWTWICKIGKCPD